MAKPLSWFEVLESARKLSPDDSRKFTAPELAVVAGIDGTKLSTASQIATAWLSKFVKWKYAVVVAKIPGEAGRVVSAYALTDAGRDCEIKAGCETHLHRLLDAVRTFQRARGQRTEGAAFTQLIKVADEAGKRE